jgi:hypothetical protein
MTPPSLSWLTVFVLLFVVAHAEVGVSGLSSGGYQAVQLHVSYSSEIVGAGIVAAGPYWCAMDVLANALEACMKHPTEINVSALWDATEYAATLLSIDNPKNLAKSRIYIYSGMNDTVVAQGVVQKLLQYYLKYLPASNIAYNFSVPSEHGYPTTDYGLRCNELGSPYVLNCGYDAAGALLQQVHGPLRPPVAPVPANLVQISQNQFLPGGWLASAAGVAEQGYVYFPTGCAPTVPSNCSRVHLALHGCQMTAGLIGDAFTMHAGYNGWAEANQLVVIYPQAASNSLNPDGCWDWWGFTGPTYASQLGVQPRFLRAFYRGIQQL